MTNAETKAYIATLKKIAKSNHLDILKDVAIRDGVAETTNLETMVRIRNGIAGQGVFKPMALDVFAGAPDADLTPYIDAKYTLDDWVELQDHKWSQPIEISPALSDAIIEGRDYASKDMTRPALTAVWIREGEIQSTDGYRLFLSGPIKEVKNLNQEISIRSEVVDIYKKLKKYGTWTLQYTDDMIRLTNGVAEIIGKVIDAQFPDARTLAARTPDFVQRVHLPFKQLQALTDRYTRGIYINRDGSVNIDQNPTPFTATIEDQPISLFSASPRRILMPLVNTDKNVAVAVDPTLLKIFKTDKEGYLHLAITLTDDKSAPIIEVMAP